MSRPDHGAVDLDFVDDPDASDDDRALDARLARLVSDEVLALEPPPSRVDVDAAKRAAADARPRRRRPHGLGGGPGGGGRRRGRRQGGQWPGGRPRAGGADPVLRRGGFVNQGGTQVLRGDDGSLLLVPTSPPQVWFQALTSGALTRSPEGCLGLGQGEDRFQLVLWPYGTTWDAAAQVLTVPGSGQLRLGEELRLGGGDFDEGGPASDLVPAGCTTNGIWLASGESVGQGGDAP